MVCSRLDESYTDYIDSADVDQVDIALRRLRLLFPACASSYTPGEFTKLIDTRPTSPCDVHDDRVQILRSLATVGAQLEAKQTEADAAAHASPLRDFRATLKHFLDLLLYYTDFSRLSVLNSVDGKWCLDVGRIRFRYTARSLRTQPKVLLAASV